MGLCLKRDFKGTHKKWLENMTICDFKGTHEKLLENMTI